MASYGAIHYQAKAEPISTLKPIDRRKWQPSPVRPRIVAEYPNRSNDSVMVFPVAPPSLVIQPFRQDLHRKTDAYPYRQDLGFQNIFPETPKLVWLQQDDNKNRVSPPVYRREAGHFNIFSETPKLVWLQQADNQYRAIDTVYRQEPAFLNTFPLPVSFRPTWMQQIQKRLVTPPTSRQEPAFINIFSETPKLTWMIEAARIAPPPAYLPRPIIPFPFDIGVVAPVVISLDWFVDQSHHAPVEEITQREQPYLHLPIILPETGWLMQHTRPIPQPSILYLRVQFTTFPPFSIPIVISLAFALVKVVGSDDTIFLLQGEGSAMLLLQGSDDVKRFFVGGA